MRLQINERQVGNVTVLDLDGLIVMGAESQCLGQHIQRLLSEDPSCGVLMNFENVAFIDSSGLGEVMNCLTVVKKSGGTLKFSKPTDLFRDVLKATRLLNVLELYDTEEEALASFT